MRREADVSTVTVDLTVRDADAVEEVRVALGLRSLADTVRCALWWYRKFQGMPVDADLLRLRGASKARARRSCATVKLEKSA